MESKPPNDKNNNNTTSNVIPPNIKNYNNTYNNNFNPNIPMEPPSFLFNPNNVNIKSFQSGSFILTSLQKLKEGDDMDIMSELINLCDQLSICSDIVGTNPNLPKLLEEICKNLDKIYLPEIVIYSLQCINYILDINPRLANILNKNNIVQKLINIINTLEDISCLDSIVMVFEKISLKNAIMLLENNVFVTLLNVFDFMGKSQRISIMKCCQNISYNVVNYKQFYQYIKPASPILCNLIDYRENETDPHILERAIIIYSNVVINLRQCLEFEKSAEMEKELLNYNYFQNFCNILTKYFIERDKNINPELIKRILQIISLTCELSEKVVNKLLSINLLPLLVEIINFEFNNTLMNNSSISYNNINTDMSNNANSSFLTEFFSVLISLFPMDKKNEKQNEILYIKLLSKLNKEYYTYFCKEILKPLVNNIMNKSACNNLSNLIKLIIIFIKSTEKENIISYIDSKPMAQIISKLLDTNFFPYLNDLSILIDILMSKAPEFYIKNFIREGIIENMKNYIFEEDNNKKEDDSLKDEKEKDNNTKKDIKEIKSEQDIINKLLINIKKDEDTLNKQMNILDDLLILNEESFKQKREEYINEQKILAKKKINEIYKKYFSEEEIKKYNKKGPVKNDDISNLKDVLSSLGKDLSESMQKGKEDKEKMRQSLKATLDILSNPINEITFFELENSNILLGLCEFLEPQFKSLYDKLDFKNDAELQKNIDLSSVFPSPLIYNQNIFEKVQSLLDYLKESKEKLISFIKLIQYSITSMNCFTMIIDDSPNNNINFYYNQVNLYWKKFNIKVYYNETSYIEKILNNKYINDDLFKAKCSEYNYAFKSAKEFKFLLDNNFDDLSSYLLSNTNVPFIYNENYEIVFDYFLDLNYKNVRQKFTIESKWGIREIKIALIEKYGKTVAESYFGSPIYFGIEYRYKKNDGISVNNINDDFNSKGYKEILISSIGKNIVKFANINKELFNFDKNAFIKDYHNLIIYSSSLYEIKRLMPSLYLLSILNLVIKKYQNLFNIDKEYFKNSQEFDELFINPKVTLLISSVANDAYSISRSNLPSWCKKLNLDCGFLSKFDSRQLLFKVSFDPRRSLINLQNYLKGKDPNYRGSITLEKSMRLKIIVERNKTIENGLKILDNPVTCRFKGYLEFEFLGEIGNGIGPTLEFYRIITEKLFENKDLWYKTTDKSIYPAIGLNNNKKALQLFKLLGYILARAIYDDRLLDFPLSRIFWNVLLDKSVKLSDIKIIDKDLYNVVNDLLELIRKKKEYINSNKNKEKINEEELEGKILYNGKKLSSVDIYFTFPGYEIELKPNGSNTLLTMSNIEEYVNLIYDYIFYKGIFNVIEAFKEGFNVVFDIKDLKCFASEELEEIIFGTEEQIWEEEILLENLKPEHGYTQKSSIFIYMVKYMLSLNNQEQKKFLIFSTGASRLPFGGFKSLSPKLTIVKYAFNKGENPDNFLPSVMTCQNYMKIPEYSTFEIFKEKMNLAINEGSNEFHLS